MENALWLEYQKLFNLNLTWRADLSCPETTGPEISIFEVSFVLPLELVLKNSILLGMGAWMKGFIRPLPSLTEGNGFGESTGPRRHDSRLDLALCILIECQCYAAEEGLELYLGVIDKGCLIFLSFTSIVDSFLESDLFQFFVKLSSYPDTYRPWL